MIFVGASLLAKMIREQARCYQKNANCVRAGYSVKKLTY